MANLTIKDLPDRLHKELKKLAEREGRSLNAQIIRTLQDGLALDERRRRLEAARRRLREMAPVIPRGAKSSLDLLREDRASH